MIWHIFKKDFRLLWRFAAGTAAIDWFYTFLGWQMDRGTGSLGPFRNFMSMLVLLASGLLVAVAVQQDALPGVRQDWLIRPIRRRDLLLAKLLFVVLLVQAPMFVADMAQALADGFPLGPAAGASLVRCLCFLAAFYGPALAIAAVTRNFAETVIGVVAAAAVLAALTQLINMMWPWHWRLSTPTGSNWIAQAAMFLVEILGVSAILGLQYFLRRTSIARVLTASTAVLCILTNFVPWQPVFAIQRNLSPQPGAASALNLAFYPDLGPAKEWSGELVYQAMRRISLGPAVYVPIRVSGLQSDTILRTDLLLGSLTGADGKVESLELARAPLVINEGSASQEKTAHYTIYVGETLFEKYRAKPVKLDLDYSLTLFRLNAAYRIPALGGRENLPELGQCTTSMNGRETAVQVRCLQAGSTPPCSTFTLYHAPSGARGKLEPRCLDDYMPFLELWPDALRRTGTNIAFRDPAGRWQAPVDGPKLKDSEVVMRLYQPLEHFTRHVVIPDVRLQDWLPK